MVKHIVKNTTIFIACGLVYFVMELIARGRSDVSMILCAGVIGLLTSQVNNLYSFEMLLQWQLLIGTGIATVCEGVTGLMLCGIYGYNPVWDYSELWGTFFFGQCNIFFCGLWFVLCFVAILIGDAIEYYCFDFGGERPYYKLCKGKVWFMMPEK